MRNRLFFLLFLLVLLVLQSAGAQTAPVDSLRAVRRAMCFPIENRSVKLYDVHIVQTEDWEQLYRIPNHPAFDSLLTPQVEQEILAEINARRREFGKDTMVTADYFRIWLPYYEWLLRQDPHYRIVPTPTVMPEDYKNSKAVNYSAGMRRLPFGTLSINDTVLVRSSTDSLFRVGDMILSINGIPMEEYLKYCYKNRYSSPAEYMVYYYFSFGVDRFDIRLMRSGKEIAFTTNGLSTKELLGRSMEEEYNIQIRDGVGYIQIKQFYPDNGRLIKIVRTAIEDFKKQGVTNVILDLRRNPGGSGNKFDKLLSIFIDKPSIPYLKGQTLRVSEQTLGDYKFLTREMIGTNVRIPDELVIKEIELLPKHYIAGMNYYVLVSQNTGSVAASFANILQYNDAAKLVGEPLMRNALRYGEIIRGGDILPALLMETAISTTQFDEYTKAVDGVIMPDIPIPFVAADYLSGKDGMLEKLIEMLR